MRASRLAAVVVVVGLLVLSFGAGVYGQTTIRVAGHWAPGSEQHQMFMANAERYMELNPGVRIEFIHVQTDQLDGIGRLLLLQTGDTAVDIVHAYSALVPSLLEGGFFAAPPDHVAREIEAFFVPQIVAGLSYDGKLYGIPTENITYVLGYNEEMSEESGVAGPPANWEELRLVAAKLSRVAGDGTPVRYGMAMGWSHITLTHGFLNLLWSNGGEYLDPSGKAYLNQDPAYETLNLLAEMYQTGSFGISDMWNSRFALGEAAMSIIPSFFRTVLLRSDRIDYGSIRTAIAPNHKGPKTAVQYGWGFFVTATSEKQDAAWEFLKWLTMTPGPEGATPMGLHMAGLGSLPTNVTDMAAIDRYRAEPYFEAFLESLAYARPEPLIPGAPERHGLINSLLRPAIRGEEPIQATLDEMNRQVELTVERARQGNDG